ncbi:sensor histidine kinase [Saccharibacillus kuerlensis]|uniref:Histidine kinase n=1 Tax=Saccharibacillus kuerlensis TaxID=459527 RepID=A0ABQ2L033_9BACL|nr:sensor histidine kinase [Saccharibacillus kuerlensis]GGN95807.1 histidine kinase [Saccharibacillus kuerlensis]
MLFGKLKGSGGRASLQTKFLLAFAVLLLIVLGIFAVYVNQMVVRPLRDRTENEMRQTAAKISDQLNLYVDSQNQLSQRILSSQDIFTLMPSGDYSRLSVEGLSRSRKLREIMFQSIGPSMNIEDVAIYDLRGALLTTFISAAGNPSSLLPFLEESEQNTSWIENGYALYRTSPDRVFFVRSIINQNGKIFGYMAIQLQQDMLDRSASVVSSGSEVYVLDPDRQPIYASGNLKSADLAGFSMPTSEKDSSGVYLDSQGDYVAYYRSNETGWTTYTITPKKVVLGPVNSVTNVSMLLIASLLLFSAAYIYFSARNFLLPIRRLRSQILHINYSNMDTRVVTPSSNNELLLLNEAFQGLLDRLQVSIEREKLAVHEEAVARNSALQAQIAPHFIHNTLYLISIAAQEGKNAVVSEMCKNLSDSLRYIVSSPYQHVSLTQELEHTKHYLTLLQHNYEDDLEWTIDEDRAFDSIRLPRLVIQPFVENCIEHAFKQADTPWRIEIRVKLYNGLWALEIRDNGDGFDSDTIAAVLGRIRTAEVTEKEEYKDSANDKTNAIDAIDIVDAIDGVDEISGIDDRNGSRSESAKESETGIGGMGIVNTVRRLQLMYKNRLFFNMYNHNDDGGGAAIQIIGSLTEDFY